jgi:hypothetical protein
MTTYDEERLAELLAALPPAPAGWVKAAQELPAARLGLDEIMARIEEDEAFRRACRADLETALAEAGYEPDAGLLAALRERFPSVS